MHSKSKSIWPKKEDDEIGFDYDNAPVVHPKPNFDFSAPAQPPQEVIPSYHSRIEAISPDHLYTRQSSANT